MRSISASTSGSTARSISPSAERLFGWTAAEAIGQNVSLLMPSPYRQAHDGYLDRYARTVLDERGRPTPTSTWARRVLLKIARGQQ